MGVYFNFRNQPKINRDISRHVAIPFSMGVRFNEIELSATIPEEIQAELQSHSLWEFTSMRTRKKRSGGHSLGVLQSHFLWEFTST